MFSTPRHARTSAWKICGLMPSRSTGNATKKRGIVSRTDAEDAEKDMSFRGFLSALCASEWNPLRKLASTRPTQLSMNVQQLLQQRFQAALTGVVPEPARFAAMIKPAQDPKFGDYQANCAMSLAKELGKKPRDIAQEI